MGKLFDTFTKIESGRNQCIDSLRSIDIDIQDDATLDMIAYKIKDKAGVVDYVKDNHIWTRPEEWVDTEALLLNAPEFEGYTPFVVYLLHDNRPDITLRLTPLGTATNSAFTTYITNAYYFSDGTFITHTGTSNSNETITHTWDASKDIKTNLHYNLRYLIGYMHETKNNTASSFCSGNDYGIGDSLLEMVFKNPRDVNTTLNIPRRTGNTTINAQRIHILDCLFSFQNNNGEYSSLKEIQIDKTGQLNMSGYGFLSYSVGSTSAYSPSNINLILPNVTTIYTASNNSSWYVKCNYVYAPNLETFSGGTSYGDWYVTKLYAPKLSKISTRKINMSQENIYDLPLLKNNSSINANQYRYMDPFFYRIDTTDATLTRYTSISLYNPTITHLTNTSAININNNSVITNIDLPALITVDNPEIFNTSFSQSITNFNIGDGFKSSLNISYLKYISTINLLDILYKLADVTNEEETYTLTLGTTLLAMLSDDEKAIATNKGWVLA